MVNYDNKINLNDNYLKFNQNKIELYNSNLGSLLYKNRVNYKDVELLYDESNILLTEISNYTNKNCKTASQLIAFNINKPANHKDIKTMDTLSNSSSYFNDDEEEIKVLEESTNDLETSIAFDNSFNLKNPVEVNVLYKKFKDLKRTISKNEKNAKEK